MNNNDLNYETTCKLRYLVNKGKGIDFIASKLGLSEEIITRFLFDSDYILEGNNIVHNKKSNLPIKYLNYPSNYLNMLFISDTHLGHYNDNIDLLKDIYLKARDRDVDIIFHLGDLGNGNNKESKIKNFESLKNYCIRHYPYSEVDTYILSGNHDYYNKEDKDLVKEVTDVRGDLNYLGNRPLIVVLNNFKFLLAHGDDRKKYYHKLYKSSEADLLIYGHEHCYGLVKNKDYQELKVPSLLDDGSRDMGVWWLSINNNDINYELETFPKRTLKK